MSSNDTPASCTRAWYATWTGCKCPRCKRTDLHVRKLKGAGLLPAAPTDQANTIVRSMLARGWSCDAISSACNIHRATTHRIITGIKTGHQLRLTTGHAQRIINHGEPTKGYVGAAGPMRKLRALAWMGHSLDQIAQTSGTARTALSNVRRQRGRWVNPDLAKNIDTAWRQLSMVRGTCTQSRNLAIRNGWDGPMAWDDDTIDYLDQKPIGSTAATALRELGEEAA